MRVPLPHGDQQLVQIIDAALADTARRSGEWLVCKPGCTQCCIGAFAINQLDAVRLQQGLAELDMTDPDRAAQVRNRARASIARLCAETSQEIPRPASWTRARPPRRSSKSFANDEPCPVLDPQTGMCDLYAARPMTCRVFGPPVQSEGGLGVCELCYHGASEAEIAACEMTVDPEDMEPALLDELERSTGRRGRTIVAFAVGL